MMGQRGFFATDERLQWLSAAGDPLERLAAVVDFELFRGELDAAQARRNCSPPWRLGGEGGLECTGEEVVD